jgi:hypothetical protein
MARFMASPPASPAAIVFIFSPERNDKRKQRVIRFSLSPLHTLQFLLLNYFASSTGGTHLPGSSLSGTSLLARHLQVTG